MSINEYHFLTRWRVVGTVEEVADIVGDLAGLARWWPSVFLGVEVLERGDRDGIGNVVSVCTRGWSPDIWLWQFGVVKSRHPYGFTLDAWGDVNGRGVWTFEQDGPWVNVSFDWKLRLDKPSFPLMAVLFRPIFIANYRWAMARGEESLREELRRRLGSMRDDQFRVVSPFGEPRRFRSRDSRRAEGLIGEWS